jgi:two-component system, cell cycle sensor histidine kinase and response regulator CckA
MTEMIRKPELTILLVDDDPLIRDLGRELLEHLGYRVETAADGAEALNKFQNLGQIDLILLDYYLPDKNGRQLLKDFKALDARARVLMASGFLSWQEAATLKDEGALGLIYKPFRLTDLEHRIQSALKG